MEPKEAFTEIEKHHNEPDFLYLMLELLKNTRMNIWKMPSF